jgi:hypothetical protein
MSSVVLELMLAQVQEAATDLRDYPPVSVDWSSKGVDWFSRSQATTRTLVPWLTANAAGLKAHVERILSAPDRLRETWDKIRESVDLPEEILEEFESTLSDMGMLHEYISGEVASAIVMRYLQAEYPNSDLRPNGKSDYPDLWLRTNDYTQLPSRRRGAKSYGAAVVGTPPRPVRVPDGLEVKTCRDTFRVDCHHNHVGLHLVVVFSEQATRFTVNDILVAFLKSSDHRRCDRNTTATTDKFSFGGDRFMSLLKPPVAVLEPAAALEA